MVFPFCVLLTLMLKISGKVLSWIISALSRFALTFFYRTPCPGRPIATDFIGGLADPLVSCRVQPMGGTCKRPEGRSRENLGYLLPCLPPSSLWVEYGCSSIKGHCFSGVTFSCSCGHSTTSVTALSPCQIFLLSALSVLGMVQGSTLL